MEDADLIDRLKGPFDIIILSDTIGYLDDCEEALAGLHSLCTPDTRLIVFIFIAYIEINSARKGLCLEFSIKI